MLSPSFHGNPLIAWTRRTFIALAICLGAASAAAQDEAPAVKGSAKNCPPTATAPTAEQIQEGMKEARDRGFLWRLRKDGRTSYLYGTLHIGKLAWAFPGPNLVAALRGTEVLALELDITDPAIMERLVATQKAVPVLALSPELRDRLARQAAAACLPEKALAALPPILEAATYAMLEARWDGLDASFGQDLLLAGFAGSIGRSIVSLETPEQQLALLQPADPKRAKKLLEQTLDQLEQGSARSVIVRLAAVWASGDLAELEDYPRWCDCAATAEERAFLREVNDDRNPNLAARIDSLHAEGKPFLVAVGALHMTGDKALPKLLAKRGFQIERVKSQ